MMTRFTPLLAFLHMLAQPVAGQDAGAIWLRCPVEVTGTTKFPGGSQRNNNRETATLVYIWEPRANITRAVHHHRAHGGEVKADIRRRA